MTQHEELIEKLQDEIAYWSGFVIEDRAPDTLSDYLEPHVKELSDALESQSREIAALKEQVEVLHTDAERYAVVRRGQHWSVIDGIGDPLTGERLDAGVDAVIAAKGGQR